MSPEQRVYFRQALFDTSESSAAAAAPAVNGICMHTLLGLTMLIGSYLVVVCRHGRSTKYPGKNLPDPSPVNHIRLNDIRSRGNGSCNHYRNDTDDDDNNDDLRFLFLPLLSLRQFRRWRR